MNISTKKKLRKLIGIISILGNIADIINFIINLISGL